LVRLLIFDFARNFSRRLAQKSPANRLYLVSLTVPVKLIFSEEISIKLSGAAVTVSDGPIATAPAAVVAGDPKALAVALKAPLKPGVYKVRWHAVASDDGHRTQGTYSFTVK